jgi:hypothetical protein
MRSLIIQATESTPHIVFDVEKNLFEMKGESRPENTKSFYDPVIEWIKDFCIQTIQEKKTNKIVFTVFFEYFSSSSAKYLMNIFARLDTLHENKIPIEIKWIYNDIDIEMKEAGEEFQKLLSMPFRFEVITH